MVTSTHSSEDQATRTTPALAARGAVAAALPPDERERLEALHRYHVLDTAADERYDDLATLAATICDTPSAAITFIDTDRQWFKSAVGIGRGQTPRSEAFCAHTILDPDHIMEVEDTHEDARFAGNPVVTDSPHIRFYAGAPLLTPDGRALGALCVMDDKPRSLSATQRKALSALSRQVVAQLELRRHLASMELDSMTDGLTGAWNRRAFDRRLGEEWNHHRSTGQPLSLCMLDVDHFKKFNDEFGHAVGDQVLVQMARAVQQVVRSEDFFARYGGEEFAVVLPRADNAAATAVASRARAAVEAIEGLPRTVTISLGVHTFDAGEGGSAGALVAQADRALYTAKQTGRNRVVATTGDARITA